MDRSALFVRDANLWTSGGVTTGIDMSLAMIESDCDRVVAGQVAGALVMSYSRVGNQAQYSSELRAQTGRYAHLVDWLSTRLNEPLTIGNLALQTGETERTFCRRFTQTVGRTPGQFVEDLRLQKARRMLEGGKTVNDAARSAGFTSAEHLARVFKKRLNMTPVEYARQHSTTAC